MKEALKPNDMFVATVSNVNASTLDLVANDINFDNTQFLSKEEYKDTPFVQKMFTKDDVFDEALFDQFYNLASEKYKELSDKKSYDSLEDFIEYDPFSASAPVGSKRRTPFVSYEKQINPRQQKIGIENFNTWSKSDKSLKELAQSHKIWDPETETWSEDSPESLSFFEKTLGHSLSYAKYETTGEQVNPVTGELGFHEAGEWILDEQGQVFTQYTPKTDLLHSEIVAVSDILTDEDSALNSIDIFDSDDLNKSATGIVIKNLLKIIPYFVPQTRNIWGAVQAIYGTTASLPTVYKQVDALATNGNFSNAYVAASGMENWFKKFDLSTTDESKQSFFNLENGLGLVSDIFGQIYQQKAAAKLGTTLGKLGGLDPKKVEDVEKLSKLGQQMSLGYMALTGTTDVYNTAIQSGYDNRTAAIAGLLSAGALFGIMNLNTTTRGIGTWFLGPEDGVNTRAMNAVTGVAKSMFKEIGESLEKGGIKQVQQTFKSKLYSALDDLSKNSSTILKAGTSELLEETSEEVIQDAVKGIIDGASALGLTSKQGNFGVIDDITSLSGIQRYITVALGGFAGGSLFHVQQNYLDPLTNKWFRYNGPVTTLSDQLDNYNLVTALMEGRYEDIMNEIDRCKKFLPKDKFTGLLDQNGQAIEFLGETDLTQADVIANVAKKQVQETYQNLKSILGEANLTEKRIFDLTSSHLDQLKEFNLLSENNEVIFTKYLNAKNADLLTKASELKKIYDHIKDKTEISNAEKEEAKENYENALDALKKHFSPEGFVNDIVEGYVITNPVFASMMNPFISEENFYKTFYENTDEFKNVDYKNLTEEQKKTIKSRLEIARKFEGDTDEKMLVQAPILRHMYLTAQERFSKPIKEWLNIEKRNNLFQALKSQFDAHANIYQIVQNLKQLGNTALAEEIFTNYFADLNLAQKVEDTSKLDLLALNHKYNLAEELIKSKIIQFTLEETLDENKKGFNVLKDIINQVAQNSSIQQWDKDTLQNLVIKVNEILKNPGSNYITYMTMQNDEELTPEDFMHLSIQLTDNEENLNKFVKDNQLIKTKAFIDLISNIEDSYITKEEFDYIINQIRSIYNVPVNNKQNNTQKIQQLKESLWYARDIAKTDAEKEEINNHLKILEKLSKTKIEENPFVKLFNAIYFDLYNETENNILDVMNKWNSNLESNLDLDEEDVEKLDRAILTINFMKNIINGMYTNEKGLGVNSALQGYIDQNKDSSKKNKDDFQTINDDDYKILNMYFDDIQTRLNNFKNLNSEMSKSKSEEFKKIRSQAYDALINSYKQFENNIIKDIVEKVSREDDDDDETYLFKIRMTLYKNRDLIFKEIENIVNLLEKNNLKSHFSLKESIKDNKINNRILILDLLASISVNPKEFLEKSREIYTKENFDPRYDQEFIMHGVYAWVKSYAKDNENAKKAYEIYINKLNEIFDDSKILLNNALSIYGAAGSGKTAVASIICKMIDSEVYATSTEEKKVNDLKNILDIKEDRAIKLDELIKEDLVNFIKKVEDDFEKKLSENNQQENYTYEYENNGFKISCDIQFKNNTIINIKNLEITKDEKSLNNSDILNKLSVHPNLLIFNDEVQLNNIFYNYLLNKTGIPIIRIGAHDQVGYSFTYKIKNSRNEEEEVTVPWDEASYVSIIMPKLLGMYRADNSLMKEIVTALSSNLNMEHAGVVLGNLDEEVIIDNKENKSVKEKNELIKFKYSLTLQGKKQFSGIRIDDNINSNFINDYLPKEKTIVITSSKDLPDELKGYERKTLEQSLGSEWEYVIYYEPIVNTNTRAFNATKQMYSAITRAKQGVYIINKNTKSSIFEKSGLNPKSIEVSNVKAYTSVKKTDIENRINQINQVLEKLKNVSTKKNIDDEILENEEINVDEFNEEQDDEYEENQEKIITNTQRINELEEKEDKTEDDENDIQELKNEQEKLKEKQKELGEHYDLLSKDWRIIQTFYRRAGKNYNDVLNKLEDVNSITELRNKVKSDTEFQELLSKCNEDFGAFILLLVENENENVKVKPDFIKDNKVYWIGLFQQFILSTFDKADGFYFWHKKYDKNEDILLYKENNKYPKEQDDDLYLITFNYKGKRFTLGQIAYKDETEDFIAKSEITEAPKAITLKEIPKDNIREYVNSSSSNKDRTCVKSDKNNIYRISGIRTFTRDNEYPIYTVSDKGFLLDTPIKANTLERYWLSGAIIDLTSNGTIKLNDANTLRNNNNQASKKYEDKNKSYYRYRKISMSLQEGKDISTAIRTELHTLNIQKILGGNNVNYKKRNALQLLDYYLNKKHLYTKQIPNSTDIEFNNKCAEIISKLRAQINTITDTDEQKLLNDFLTEIENKILNDNSKTVNAFLNIFNAKCPYYSFYFQKSAKHIGQINDKPIELSDAVIESPNLLIVPELKSQETTSTTKIEVKEETQNIPNQGESMPDIKDQNEIIVNVKKLCESLNLQYDEINNVIVQNWQDEDSISFYNNLEIFKELLNKIKDTDIKIQDINDTIKTTISPEDVGFLSDDELNCFFK